MSAFDQEQKKEQNQSFKISLQMKSRISSLKITMKFNKKREISKNFKD